MRHSESAYSGTANKAVVVCQGNTQGMLAHGSKISHHGDAARASSAPCSRVWIMETESTHGTST